MERPKPPDLQEYVVRFVGYNKITPEGWAEYDRSMAEYQQRRREVVASEIMDYRQAKKEEATTTLNMERKGADYFCG
jgi:hypothetical protein